MNYLLIVKPLKVDQMTKFSIQPDIDKWGLGSESQNYSIH